MVKVKEIENIICGPDFTFFPLIKNMPEGEVKKSIAEELIPALKKVERLDIEIDLEKMKKSRTPLSRRI